MKKSSRARVVFLFGVLVVSTVVALLATYAYGGLYAHHRYWVETKQKIASKEALLIAGLAEVMDARGAFPRDSETLAAIFAPVNGLLLVELRYGDHVEFSNREPRFTPSPPIKTVSLGGSTTDDLSDDGSLVISDYVPPTWSRQFWRWLSQPGRWREPSFDVTTAPFVAFFAVSFVLCLGLGWRARAGYLERDVLAHLRKGGRE